MAIGVIGSVSFSPAVSVSAEESNSEFENPVYDEATDTTDYDYAYFGMYPTSEVTGDALTDEIKMQIIPTKTEMLILISRWQKLMVLNMPA